MCKMHLNTYDPFEVYAYTLTWYPQPEHLERDHAGCPCMRSPLSYPVRSFNTLDPLLPLGQTQSPGLHGLQIRYATPIPLPALWSGSASSTLLRRC